MVTPVGWLTDALIAAADRFASLARSALDPELPVAATPGWTVTDVIGHVSSEPSRYRDLALGRGEWPRSPAELPAFNAHQVATLPTRDLCQLSERLVADVDALVDTVLGFGSDPPLMNFDGDQRVPADRMLGSLLGELVVHGRDVAAALGQPWPIDGAVVPLIMEGVNAALPGWVDQVAARGFTATIVYQLRGLAAYRYVFRNGALSVESGHDRGRPADARVSAEPVAGLLVSYGRLHPLRAALTGRVVATGRRPWLAMRMRRVLLPA
jgi:uncharacterized protein (TIGR03083 family)